ncbi:uncharacterized protein LOC143211702 [Lasioglossum baleicum]|uniref:uncharacterized protein LOC143211702 n=1 Tax=Lasioglossum baleicum TaxID=434251 RepID=UPI003FCDE775
MHVTEVLILVVQFAVVSGRLTILTGREDTDWTNRKSRELVCVSDDDGAGLTWNRYLQWEHAEGIREFRGVPTNLEEVTPFQNPNQPRSRSLLDCDLNWNDNCTSSWSTEGWGRTSSFKTPMGPVLDRRWEEFEEVWMTSTSHYKAWRIQSFAVSIRGTADANIFLCEHNEFCYWIIIGYIRNTKSVIRKCKQNDLHSTSSIEEMSCNPVRDVIAHRALSPFEWKTFVVTWNKSTGIISVYDSERMILTFVDSEKRLSKQDAEHYAELLMYSNTKTTYRLHNYNFLNTTDRDAVLASPVLNVTTTNFCVEMAIGLCAECQLELTLVDAVTKKVEHTLEVIVGRPTIHGLPAWRYVRINKSISLENSKVKLRMVTIQRQETPNPLWAVANVRSCPLADSIRKVSMKAIQDYDSEYYWPNITCQKLFYNDNTVVSSLPPATLNMEFADSDCQLGKVGPYCSVDCTKDLQLEEDCKNAKICEESGCTCSPGYTGPRCDERCAPPQYGRHCNQTCDFCLHNKCNFRTGECTSGCDQSRGYKVPPLCKIGIDPPPPVTIDFINETTVHVSLPVKEEYKLVHPIYRFQILKEGERNERNFEDVTMKHNDTKLIAYRNTLQPGVSYSIRCILQTDLYSPDIPGQWNNFTTRCNPSTSFDVELKNTSLILSSVSQDSTSCPAKWYDIVFENRDTGERTHSGPLSSLPHEFEHLTPFTVYKIEITKGAKEYFSREVRTLEAECAPEQLTVDWLLPIIVQWFPPIMLGIILAVVAFCLYQRKRVKRPTDDDVQEEIALGPYQDSTITSIASPRECLSPVDTQPGDCWLIVSHDQSN